MMIDLSRQTSVNKDLLQIVNEEFRKKRRLTIQTRSSQFTQISKTILYEIVSH